SATAPAPSRRSEVKRLHRWRVAALLAPLACVALGLTQPQAALAASPAQKAEAAAERNRALFDALRAQDGETALYLLKAGADARAREPDGTTPLHYAAHYADTRLIEALLKGRADPDAANEFGARPLALAATSGHAETIRLLLKAGADVEAQNPEG